ncbi:hypothetical protein QBC45DRAFT_394477 [Copromyces sp. CBS 386.78]|nr:hypothetical protein QBC45DRAFT_394477 [Copromyces sp. CBS 386.78]
MTSKEEEKERMDSRPPTVDMKCALVSVANMQYGLDSACLAALQAMPGFLKVFGYPDPSAPGGYGIGHTFQQLVSSFLTLGSLLSTLFAGPFSHLYGRRI